MKTTVEKAGLLPDAMMKVKLAVIAAACGIQSLSEADLLRRLEGLVVDGFGLGVETSKGALDAAAADLAKIAIAYLSGDADRLVAVLDEFVRERCQAVAQEKTGASVH